MNKPATSDELVKMEAVLQQRGGFFGRWGRWITLAILLAAAGAGYWRFQQSGRKAGPEQTFVTEPATRVDLVVRVTATGTVQPTTQVDISSEMSGIMRKVFVDFNSKVKTGDALAELDRAKLEASVEASKARVSVAIANVQDAQAALKEKRLAWERKQQLSRTNVVSKQDLETARASYDRAAATVVSAVASVNLAKADLKLQQTNLDRTRILSPINGIILMRKVDPGQ
ncbi:MAG: efflux RND transporter periplasmic adaptor subunit, partial [Beijerinckiaceae bacterium]